MKRDSCAGELAGSTEFASPWSGRIGFPACVGRRPSEQSPYYHDDGLTDFLLEEDGDFPDPPANGETGPARWISPGESVRVGRFEITGGFFYLGRHVKDPLDGYVKDPSLVDPALECASADRRGNHSRPRNYQDFLMSYSDMPCGHRALYLEWLSGERSDPEVPIDYVLLYVAGIERRLLVDDLSGMVSRCEFVRTTGELKRLKNVYGHKKPFDKKVSGLLSYALVANHHGRDGYPDMDMLKANPHCRHAFRFLLARNVKQGGPLDAPLAIAWVKTQPDFNPPAAARRCPQEFETLFIMRYRQKFGDGLKIKPNRTPLSFSCETHNISLKPWLEVSYALPDPSVLKAPFKKLAALAESCAEELAPLSRLAGNNSRESLRAFTLLPRDLAERFPHPRFGRMRDWINSMVPGAPTLISVESILRYFGREAPLKMNRKETEMLSDILEKAGFGMAPHPVFHNEKPHIGARIAVFPGGHGDDFNPSATFKTMKILLDMGSMLLPVDCGGGVLGDCALKDSIHNEDRLSETEKCSLEAYFLWRAGWPLTLSGLRARVRAFDEEERVAFGCFLVCLAAAEKRFSPAAATALGELLCVLGFDKTAAAEAFRAASPYAGAPPDSRICEEIAAGVYSPADLSAELDHDLVSRYEEETGKVRMLLEDVFDNEARNDGWGETDAGARFPCLDSEHELLYRKIITKERWSTEEFRELCDDLRLMPEAAFEAINDWTFEEAGAALLENGSLVSVDLQLAEEIKTLHSREN